MSINSEYVTKAAEISNLVQQELAQRAAMRSAPPLHPTILGALPMARRRNVAIETEEFL
jgi:hypothetical protein